MKGSLGCGGKEGMFCSGCSVTES